MDRRHQAYADQEDSSDGDPGSDRARLISSVHGQHPYHRQDYGATVQQVGKEEQSPPRSIELFPFLLINLVVVFVCAAGRFHSPLMSQYLYQRYSDQILGHHSVKTTSHPCLNDTASNSSEQVRKIQKMTSQMLLHLDLCNYGPGIASCLVLGAMSGWLSRRALLLIPVTGYLVKCVMIPIVVHWNLDVNWFFLGYGTEGVLGNLCGLFFGVFLYTSDITGRDFKRTWGLAMTEGVKGLVGSGLNLVTGQLIQKTGFIIPAMLSAGLTVLSVLIILALPNRKPNVVDNYEEEDGQRNNWWTKLCLPLGRYQPPKIRQMVIVGWIAFILTQIASAGITKVRILYLINLPFCFDAIGISWFLFGRSLSYNVFLVLAIPLLHRCMPGMALGILGAFSSLAGFLMFAFATTDAEIYSIIALSIGQSLPLNIIRGETSRLLGPEAQGPLFAALGVFESISYTLGTGTLSIYKATLDFYKGTIHLIFSAFMLIVTILLIIYHAIWLRYTRSLQTQTLLKPSPAMDPRVQK